MAINYTHPNRRPAVNLRKPVSLVKRPRAGERVNYVKAGA